jgi:hypothetical protein
MARYRHSINEHQMNAGRISKRQVTQDFSPEVQALAGTLVPVVSTVTWWFVS